MSISQKSQRRPHKVRQWSTWAVGRPSKLQRKSWRTKLNSSNKTTLMYFRSVLTHSVGHLLFCVLGITTKFPVLIIDILQQFLLGTCRRICTVFSEWCFQPCLSWYDLQAESWSWVLSLMMKQQCPDCRKWTRKYLKNRSSQMPINIGGSDSSSLVKICANN